MRSETIRYHVKPFEGANIEEASLAVNGIDPDHPLRPAIDERDALLRDLSSLIHISTVPQNDGALNVFIGSGQSLSVTYTCTVN